MEIENIKIENVELVHDLKGFLSANYEDIIIDKDIENKIYSLKNDDLVLVEKQINSPTKIIKVTLIDEELISKYL